MYRIIQNVSLCAYEAITRQITIQTSQLNICWIYATSTCHSDRVNLFSPVNQEENSASLSASFVTLLL